MAIDTKGNGTARILIAEDSPTQAAQLRHLLENRGFEVKAASNGREALALLDQWTPTLVLSDVMMPELDGYGLCRAIKASEQWRHLPVMLVTTLSDAEDVVRGLECGADNFIRKPYDEKYLLSRISYLLMNQELRRNQKMRVGLEINLGGQRHFITSERQQILDLLISTYEQAIHLNDELRVREKELAHSNSVLQGLYRIAVGLNQAASEREVAELALERAMELPGVQAGWIFLREGESGFRVAAARNQPPALDVAGALEGECVCRRRLLSGDLDSVTNILECERLQRAEGDTRGLLYHASVPLWLGERTLGVMNLVGSGVGLFNDDELKVLYGVGNQLAVALERARLHEHLEAKVEERTARIVRLNRTYMVLSGINSAIVHVRDRQRLFEEACRIAVEEGLLRFAWIGVLDAESQEVTPVAKAGIDDGYLSQVNLTAKKDAPNNCELTWLALTQGAPVVCHDVASDDRMTRWRTAALERGYRSVALFPLVLNGQVAGLFVLYAAEPGAFDEGEMELLAEMADDISFAMDHLSKEEMLRKQTAALIAEIEERKRIEEAQARLVAILEATPDFVAIAGVDGQILYCNEAARRMLGHERVGEESTKRSAESYSEKADRLMSGANIQHAIEHGSWSGETAFLRADGGVVAVSQIVLAHRGPGGEVEYVSTIARDVTSRNEAEERNRRIEHRLEEARRVNSLGRVAATIAHELNNVLMGILPFVEVIRRRIGDDERVASATDQIASSVSRGKRVTEEILRFAKPVEPCLEVVDLTQWLEMLAPELRGVAGSNIELRLVLPDESLRARCDSAQLQQVVTNLVINARDATPGAGAITLTLAPSIRERSVSIGLPDHGRSVRLTVADTGAGIAPDMLEQIFEPLFSTKRSGTGLGLAVARQIISRHAGVIFAENDPRGGTAFHVVIPRVDEGVTAPEETTRERRRRIRRLLLVEDEAAVAEGLSLLFEMEGISVRVVELGGEVVRSVEEFAPDVVVLDLTLPDMDGREVFAQIVAQWPDLPVVFSTGHGNEADLAEQLKRDHVGFLGKPYTFEALLAAIDRVL
ncbi:MAG: response regulator [Acidobacteria bacterium]|nr:response regulator [Acidobacteriota bacterium]